MIFKLIFFQTSFLPLAFPAPNYWNQGHSNCYPFWYSYLGDNFQKSLLFHQQCWVGFFPPHGARLQFSHPGKSLPRQTPTVTLTGFPSALSVVSKSCFRHFGNRQRKPLSLYADCWKQTFYFYIQCFINEKTKYFSFYKTEKATIASIGGILPSSGPSDLPGSRREHAVHHSLWCSGLFPTVNKYLQLTFLFVHFAASLQSGWDTYPAPSWCS